MFARMMTLLLFINQAHPRTSHKCHDKSTAEQSHLARVSWCVLGGHWVVPTYLPSISALCCGLGGPYRACWGLVIELSEWWHEYHSVWYWYHYIKWLEVLYPWRCVHVNNRPPSAERTTTRAPTACQVRMQMPVHSKAPKRWTPKSTYPETTRSTKHPREIRPIDSRPAILIHIIIFGRALGTFLILSIAFLILLIAFIDDGESSLQI